MKFLKARVPGTVDIELGKLLQLTSAKLKTAIGDAKLVVVRSQEIDKFGEMDGDFIARQMGDGHRAPERCPCGSASSRACGNRLRRHHSGSWLPIHAGEGRSFSYRQSGRRHDRPPSPLLDRARRSSTRRGRFRVSGAELGYDTDLDFIFPTGIGVFRAGGNLAYHHGGISLQEMVIPILSLRTTNPPKTEGPEGDWSLKGAPKALNNRTFGVTIEHTGLFARSPIAVRPVLMAGGEQVGEAGMAMDAHFDRDSKTVTIDPGRPASVAMLLRREDCASIRIVVLDPTTDSVLVQSEEIHCAPRVLMMNETLRIHCQLATRSTTKSTVSSPVESCARTSSGASRSV